MLDDLVRDAAGFDLPGPAHDHRDAKCAFPIGVLLAAERRHAAIRPRIAMRTVVGGVLHEGVLGNAELVEEVEHFADVLVVVDHRVVIRRLPAPGLAQTFLLGMCVKVHVRGIEPDEPRLAGLVLALDEVLGAATNSSSHASMRLRLSGPVSTIFCLPTCPSAAVRSSRPCRWPRNGSRRAGRSCCNSSGNPSAGSSHSAPALPRRSGDTGCPRTRRTHGWSAACGSGRPGGSCRIGPSRSLGSLFQWRRIARSRRTIGEQFPSWSRHRPLTVSWPIDREFGDEITHDGCPAKKALSLRSSNRRTRGSRISTWFTAIR